MASITRMLPTRKCRPRMIWIFLCLLLGYILFYSIQLIIAYGPVDTKIVETLHIAYYIAYSCIVSYVTRFSLYSGSSIVSQSFSFESKLSECSRVSSEHEFRLWERLYHNVHAQKGPGFRVVEQEKGKLEYYDIESLIVRQEERKSRLEDYCTKSIQHAEESSTWISHLQINENRKLLYCSVTKAASTFFKRLFFAVANEEVINSPVDIGLREARTRVNYTKNVIKMLRSPERNFVKESQRVLFVRHPYSRLFSAYIDKMFAPNPIFWNLAKKIIKRYRKNTTEKSLRCGHDVTFAEVVAYVTESERNKTGRDVHFVLMHETCKACPLDYTLVGKMETFSEDLGLFLWTLGQNVSKNTLKIWGSLYEEVAILDSTFSPFGWKSAIQKCITFHEAAKRIWHKMQIRGMISKHAKMPFDHTAANHISAPKFAEALFKARDPSAQVKKQKHEALRKAFSTVPKYLLQSFQDLYKDDFDLFGYDRYPKSIFSKIPASDEDSNWVFDLKHV